jgi:hypothetical protein
MMTNIKNYRSFLMNESSTPIKANPDRDDYLKIVANNCPLYVVTIDDVNKTLNQRKKIIKDTLASQKAKLKKSSDQSVLKRFDDVVERIENEIEKQTLDLSTKWLMSINGLAGKFNDDQHEKNIINFIHSEIMDVIEGNWIYKQALKAMIDDENVDKVTDAVNKLFDYLIRTYKRVKVECTRGTQNSIRAMAPECKSVINTRDKKPVRCPIKERADLISSTGSIDDNFNPYRKKVIDVLKSYA